MSASHEQKLLLECPVCYERLKPPLETCENGHGICQRCRPSLRECGICRKKFTGTSNTLLNQLLETMSLKCKFHPYGCVESLNINNIDEHEKQCRYEPVECIICKENTALLKLNDHYKIHLSEHENIYYNKSVQCSICKSNVLLIELNKHIKIHDPEQSVNLIKSFHVKNKNNTSAEGISTSVFVHSGGYSVAYSGNAGYSVASNAGSYEAQGSDKSLSISNKDYNTIDVNNVDVNVITINNVDVNNIIINNVDINSITINNVDVKNCTCNNMDVKRRNR